MIRFLCSGAWGCDSPLHPAGPGRKAGTVHIMTLVHALGPRQHGVGISVSGGPEMERRQGSKY